MGFKDRFRILCGELEGAGGSWYGSLSLVFFLSFSRE